MAMDPEEIRRWIENHRAAAARELAEQRRLTAAEAYDAALSLLAFDEQCNGSPFDREDAVTAREDAKMWDDWKKFRASWGRGR
jgi:hypothetical protein